MSSNWEPAYTRLRVQLTEGKTRIWNWEKKHEGSKNLNPEEEQGKTEEIAVNQEYEKRRRTLFISFQSGVCGFQILDVFYPSYFENFRTSIFQVHFIHPQRFLLSCLFLSTRLRILLAKHSCECYHPWPQTQTTANRLHPPHTHTQYRSDVIALRPYSFFNHNLLFSVHFVSKPKPLYL